jgi:hypothetical protein
MKIAEIEGGGVDHVGLEDLERLSEEGCYCSSEHH